MVKAKMKHYALVPEIFLQEYLKKSWVIIEEEKRNKNFRFHRKRQKIYKMGKKTILKEERSPVPP